MKKILSTCFLFVQLSILHAQSGTIQGVIQTSDDKPVAGMVIQLNDKSTTYLSDSNGHYQFIGLAAGNYTLILHSGYTERMERKILLRDQENCSMNFRVPVNYRVLQDVIVQAGRTQNERHMTIGKSGIQSRDLPQSIVLIDRETLDNQQVQQMSDVLKNTNGVYVMGTTGGTQVEISGRGYAYGSSNTFKNGVRYNNSVMPELSSLEKVEILKGSNAILYGNVAAGGILNLVTLKPRFENGGSIQFRIGSNDFYKSSLDLYGPVNDSKHLAFRLNTSYEKANSFRDWVQMERFYINPSFLLNLNPKTQILLETDYLTDKRTLDYGTGAINYQIAEIPIHRFLGATWSSNQAEQKTITLTTTHQLSNHWQLKNISNFSGYQATLFGTTRPNSGGNFVQSNGNWIRGVQRSETSESYYLTQFDLTGDFHTGKLKHQLLIGADVDHYQTGITAFNSLAKYDSINIFNPDKYIQRKDIPNLTTNTHTRSPIIRTGFYIQDLISITEQVKLLTGIRNTFQRNKSSVYSFAKDTSTESTRDYSAWTPRIGLVYQPVQNISVFASYANSFSINNGIDTTGSPLAPSYINQYEAGIKTDLFHKNISANITIYRIVNSNLAQSLLPANPQYPNAQELAGEVTSKGLELDINTREYHGFSILAGYSYNDTRYTKSNTYIVGSRLRYNPQHTANFSIQYAFDKSHLLKGWQLGCTVFYTGERVAGRSTRLTVNNDDHKLMPVPDFTQFDITMGYVKDRISLRCKIANLLNVRSYYIHDDNSVNPIAPRQLTATLSYRL